MQRVCDLLVALAVRRPKLAIERQRSPAEPGAHRDVGTLQKARLVRGWREIETHYVIEVAAVENEATGSVVDTGAGICGRHQPAQHGRDALRIDREFKAGECLVRGPVTFARLQPEEALRIDGDGVGLHRRGGGNRARNDLALHHQALDARINQAGAELGEIENPDHERQQAGHVQEHDPAREAREADAHEEVPALVQQLQHTATLCDGRPFVVELLRLAQAREAVGRSLEHDRFRLNRHGCSPDERACARHPGSTPHIAALMRATKVRLIPMDRHISLNR